MIRNMEILYCRPILLLFISLVFLRNESIQIVSYFFGFFGFLTVSCFLSYQLKVRYSY